MKKSIMEQRIKETAQYYESIIDNMPGHVYWLDEHGFTLGCNQNVLTTFGFKSIAEFKGLSFEKIGEICKWSLETIQSFKKDSFEVIRTGRAKLNVEEPPIANQEGKLIYFLTSRVPIFDVNSKVISMVGISIDITERKKLEKKLRLAKAKAETANKAKTEFIRNMSHDLRTPLAGIIGLSNLQINEATSIREKQYGRWICNAGNQLLELLNSVIEVTANDHQAEYKPKERINLKKMAEELQALMYPIVVAKELDFQISLDSQLPIVSSERIKLKRILLNLLSNAVKFTKQGKISLKIDLISLSNTHAQIGVQITDTGIGIATDKLNKIFDRFYRVHPSYMAEYTGYGLGLYLVKKATESLGGKITVSSEEGKGSCFSLDFKFILSQQDSKPSPSYSKLVSAFQVITDSQKGSVLVAEDNSLVLYVVKKMLMSLGYQVITASTGTAALRALQTQSFNWGLLDLGLPDLDGVETIKRYRKWEQLNQKSCMPIFALTAHAGDKIKSQCKKIGFDQVFHKPFTEKDIQIIEKYLDNSCLHE